MIRSALLALAVGLMGTSATPQAADELPNIPLQGVATMVNDEPISFTDLRQRVTLLLAGIQVQPTQEILQQVTSQALDQLIKEKLQIQHAAEFDFELPIEAIHQSVDQIAAQSGATREQLYNDFAQAGINPASLEDQIRADVTWRQIMNGRFGSRIRISQNQIDDQVEQLLESIAKRRYLLSEIFLAAPDPTTQQQALAASQQLIQQMRQGVSFPEIARQISFSSTASTGGDMGWLTLDGMEPSVAEALKSAQRPGLVGPIIAANGVYIMAIREIKEPDLNPSEAVSLFQIFANDGDASRLERLQSDISDCEDAEQISEQNSNLMGLDIGDILYEQLSTPVKSAVDAAGVNGTTDVINVSYGPSLLVVCERRIQSDAIPSRDQIREQLIDEELAMISDRELRNLERRALIVRR